MKVIHIIKNFIKEHQEITFLIISIIIILFAMNYSNEVTMEELEEDFYVIPQTRVHELAEQNLLPTDVMELDLDISEAISIEIYHILDDRYMLKHIQYSTTDNITNSIRYTITFYNAEDKYNSKNHAEIETYMLEVAQVIHDIWKNYEYDILVDIDFTNYDTDLVYFTIENNEVSWSCLDPVEKWHMGDDLSEWTTDPSEEDLEDIEYLKQQELYQTVNEALEDLTDDAILELNSDNDYLNIVNDAQEGIKTDEILDNN